MNIKDLDKKKLRENIKERNKGEDIKPVHQMIIRTIKGYRENPFNIASAHILFSFLERMQIPLKDAEDFVRRLAEWESPFLEHFFLDIRHSYLLRELTKGCRR